MLRFMLVAQLKFSIGRILYDYKLLDNLLPSFIYGDKGERIVILLHIFESIHINRNP